MGGEFAKEPVAKLRLTLGGEKSIDPNTPLFCVLMGGESILFGRS